MRTVQQRLWTLLCCVIIAALLVPVTDATPARAAPDAPTDTPIPVITEFFNEWTISDGLIYWADRCFGGEFVGPGYLRRKPTNGSIVRTLDTVTAGDCVTYLNMISDNTGLFYYDGAETEIKFHASGAPDTPVTIRNDPPRPMAGVPMRLDGDYLYWMDFRFVSGSNYEGQVYRTLKDGSGGAETLTPTFPNPNDLFVLNGTVYWSDDNGIHSVRPANCSALPCTSGEITDISSSQARYFHNNVPTGIFIFGTNDLYWVNQTGTQRIERRRCTLVLQPFPNPPTTSCSISTIYTAPDSFWSIGQPVVVGNNVFFPESYFKIGESSVGRLSRYNLSTGVRDTIAETDPGSGIDLRLFADTTHVYFSGRISGNLGMYKLPFNATAIIRDIAADNLEVTQAIQNTATHDVPLVAGKTTYVRAYPRQDEGPRSVAVEGRLVGTRGSTPLPGSPLLPLNGNQDTTTGSPYDRGVLDDGWLFQLPGSWIGEGSINLRLEVDYRSFYSDNDLSNNNFSRTVSFQDKAPVCTVYVPVRTHSPYASTSDTNFWPMVDVARRLWPTREYWSYYQTSDIAETQVCWWGPFPHPCFGPYELPDDTWKVLTSLNIRDFFSDDPDECQDVNAQTHYIGMVHPSTNTSTSSGTTLGAAYRNDNVAWVKFPPASPTSSTNPVWPDAGVTLAHELAHNLGRRHVDCGGPENTDGGYPYPTNQIANTGQTSYYGFDPKTRSVIAPDAAVDYMSYCDPVWTSDYTWKALINRLGNRLVSAAGVNQTDLAAAGEAFLITGGVNVVENTGSLNYGWLYPPSAMSGGMLRKWQSATAAAQAANAAAPAEAAPLAAPYRIRLLDGQGTVLADQEVTLQESSDHASDIQTFLHTLVAPAGLVTEVQLVDGADTVLDSRIPGNNVPTVTISAPAGGETITDALQLTWQGVDGDAEDVLLYNVQYSPDDGATWFNILSEVPGPQDSETVSITLTELSIPASGPNQGRIRIAGSDGYNTGLATSNGFTVTNREPQAFIGSPTEGTQLDAGVPVLLSGAATDPEDGGLSGSALGWSLNGDPVGTGDDLLLSGLAPGEYTATLTATDSEAAGGTAQVTFTILPLTTPSAATPTLDGLCDDSGYADGSQVGLMPYSDGQAHVRLMRTAGHLWVCFSGLNQGAALPGAFAGVRVDPNNSRDAQAQADDYGFFVGEDGGLFTYTGDGAGGFDQPGPGGLAAQINTQSSTWSAELRIDKDVLGDWGKLVGLNVGHYWVQSQGDDYEWPYDTGWNQPDTWALTALGEWPVINAIAPETATAGTGDFVLRVEGDHFVDGATVRWDGADLATTYGDGTVISATVPAAGMAAAGTVDVTVRNPNGIDSNSAPFVVRNPTPAIDGLSPRQTTAEGPDFTMTINGSGFVDGATVRWNGEALPTSYVNGGQLTATVAAARLAQGQMAAITVQNPAPDSQVSDVTPFLVQETGKTFMPLTQND